MVRLAGKFRNYAGGQLFGFIRRGGGGFHTLLAISKGSSLSGHGLIRLHLSWKLRI